MKKTVYNLPEYAKNYKYIVVNHDEETGDLWFYGAWNDVSKASEAVAEVDFRFTLEVSEVDLEKVMTFPRG